MSLPDIIAKIETDARSAADEVLQAAKDDAAAEIKRGREAADNIRKMSAKKSERGAAAAQQRQEIAANLEARKYLLGVKQEGITQAILQAQQTIAALPDAEYLKWVEQLLVANALGDEEVIIAAGDKQRVTAEFIRKVNQSLAKEGGKDKLKLANTEGDFTAGIILQHPGGKVRNRLTVEALFKSRRDELAAIAATALFGEKK